MATSSEPVNDEKRVKVIEDWKEFLVQKQKTLSHPVEFTMCGYTFIGNPDVFWLNDEQLLEDTIEALPKTEKPKSHFLEIGCGTGWMSVVYHIRNKDNLERILAVDINKSAVNNTVENFKRYDIPGTARYSDVFDSITEDEKFDTIFWNTPYFYASNETKPRSDLDKSLIDPGYRSIEKFIAGAQKYLNKDGRAIITFSRNEGQLSVLEKIAEKHRQKLVFIWSKTFELPSGPFTMELVEIIPA